MAADRCGVAGANAGSLSAAHRRGVDVVAQYVKAFRRHVLGHLQAHRAKPDDTGAFDLCHVRLDQPLALNSLRRFAVAASSIALAAVLRTTPYSRSAASRDTTPSRTS